MWVRRFIFSHGVRHPEEMAEAETNAFLTHLAVKESVSASTQNQALSALLFLYRHVLDRKVGDLGDVMVLDECRYLYDWMPTLDLADRGLSDIEQQLSHRFVLDGLAKNRRWYNTEYFFGAAVVGQDTPPFDARYLAPRGTL